MSQNRNHPGGARRVAAALFLSAAATAMAATITPAPAANAPKSEPAKVEPGKPDAAKPEPPKADMQQVFLVLLRRGPNWSPTPTPESKTIQEAHLANIGRLWKEGKLAVAGPLGDNTDLRGIFIFKVATLEETKALTDSDPAIKAGRLVAEIHPWWVDRRVLPEAGKYCQSVDPE